MDLNSGEWITTTAGRNPYAMKNKKRKPHGTSARKDGVAALETSLSSSNLKFPSGSPTISRFKQTTLKTFFKGSNDSENESILCNIPDVLDSRKEPGVNNIDVEYLSSSICTNRDNFLDGPSYTKDKRNCKNPSARRRKGIKNTFRHRSDQGTAFEESGDARDVKQYKYEIPHFGKEDESIRNEMAMYSEDENTVNTLRHRSDQGTAFEDSGDARDVKQYKYEIPHFRKKDESIRNEMAMYNKDETTVNTLRHSKSLDIAFEEVSPTKDAKNRGYQSPCTSEDESIRDDSPKLGIKNALRHCINQDTALENYQCQELSKPLKPELLQGSSAKSSSKPATSDALNYTEDSSDESLAESSFRSDTENDVLSMLPVPSPIKFTLFNGT